MVRLLVSVLIRLAANAVGLVVATLFLHRMTISGTAFITAVAIFTAVEVVADPLLTKISLTHLPVLRGGVALVTTLVGLIVTTAVSDGLHISGFGTWLAATVIVWIAALVASLVLPLLFVKKSLRRRSTATP
jgi:putative membrane protein